MTRSLTILTAACLLACSSEGGAGDPADAGARADTGSDPGVTSPPKKEPKWEKKAVAGGGVGLQAALAISSDDRLAVAYYASGPKDGEICDEIGTDDPPPRQLWSLWMAEAAGSAWSFELVSELTLVGRPVGVGVAYEPGGGPVLAALSGEPVADIRFCGANDVGLYRRSAGGEWEVETAVVESGEAESGEEASDYGDVVGYWPALAFDLDGQPAVAYQDVHTGSMQRDDFARADLELAWKRGGAWSAVPVDVGAGAGDSNVLLFDGEGRPLIVSHNPSTRHSGERHGLWVFRSADEGTTWERVRLHHGKTSARVGAVVGKDGELHVAFHDPAEGVLRLATLHEPDSFTELAEGWRFEDAADPRYDEGIHPSLAVAPDGTLAAAYYRCAEAEGGLGDCRPNEDGLVFALRGEEGWSRELVDDGGPLDCGTWPSLGFRSDGRAVVAYQCVAEKDGDYEEQLKVAERKAL